jgi:type II secretory pathway pseudopilin PulG
MKKILIAVGVVTIAVGILWAGRAWNTLRVNAQAAQFNEQMENLFTALQKYKERVGSYPMGSNAEIAKALNGANVRNVIVLISAKVRRNDKGEFIDPWGTPLRIYFSDTGVLVRSAGPNRRFDDSTVIEADDYIRSN